MAQRSRRQGDERRDGRVAELGQGSRRRGGRLGLHDFALLQRRIREALPAGVLIPPLLRAAALSR
jgi:hypothetical protein